MSGLWFFLVVGLVLAVWVIGNFNTLVRLRNHCYESWAGIEVELQRRHELIPNLVKVVKGFAAHERTVLSELVAARTQALAAQSAQSDLEQAEKGLSKALKNMFAIAEGYPALLSDKHFMRLHEALVGTEDRIESARRYYNANVRDINTRIEMFPSSIIAQLFGFRQQQFLKLGRLNEL